MAMAVISQPLLKTKQTETRFLTEMFFFFFLRGSIEQLN
jgi:hypothetical protein